MVNKPTKKTVALSFGAGVGITQVLLSKQYDTVIPYLPSNWNRLSSTGNILIGAVVLGISQFTKLLSKHHYIKQALGVYAFTTITGGILNGLVHEPPAARASTGRVSTLSYGRNGQITHQYYPGFTGTFVERPATRAQGFGSDVTRNPMAAIPTTVPYNKIIA